MRWALLALLAGCGGTAPAPPAADAPSAPAPAAPRREVSVPEPVPVAPSQRTASPYARPLDASEQAARDTLAALVREHGLAPDNAWSIGHALLALGPETTLADGTVAIDHLFARFAQVEPVEGGAPVLRFPSSRGGVPVEPHAELTLKILVDLGLTPDRPVAVGGEGYAVGDLWRGAVRHAWVDGDRTSYASWNDTPWALQGIAGWAPPDARWVAEGREQTLDGFTHAVVEQLEARTAFLAEARARDGTFEKRGQEIFAFTCGGAHLVQGAAHAVARGFGQEGDRATMTEQARLQAWRFPRELATVDEALVKAPQYALLLLVQRLKFTGHHLETMHRFAALGLVPADDPELRASMEAGRAEVVRTVEGLRAAGVLDQLPAIRAQREQTFLDLIGDGAHAVRGLDLASGAATVAW